MADAVPAPVVSVTATLMPLVPETVEWVSQCRDDSYGDVGEAATTSISAVPRSFCALLVKGAEMDCTS